MAQSIKTFRDLLVWQKAMRLVTEIYQQTNTFPSDERFGLVSQIRRSAVSIPSNIAEGYGRQSTKDYIRFLQLARGSLYELQTQMEISLNLQYYNQQDFDRINDSSKEIERMMSSLIRKVKETL